MRSTKLRQNRTAPAGAAQLVDLGDIELPEAESGSFEAKIRQADTEVEAARVNFRWGTEQVDVVKKAAALAGVPYQSWMKTVLFQHAVADINKARNAGIG